MARPVRRLGNMPAQATSFIGRRRELAELKEKLRAARLVSLVGPGGVGKTRLAIRIATDLARGFPGGAWLVELADVRDSELVGNAVIAALDLRYQAATEPLPLLLAHLREKQLLLVVDNCEHLLETAAHLVSDVITAAPGVRVIATSREPLGVQGEHVLPVPPLELPAAQAAEPLAQLRQNEAVMLFTERAAAACGRFDLTASNQSAVVDLCRRLDGLPLAIELAAVRTRVLTPEQVLERLADRFALLTGGSRAALPRHQTLRTTIDWSHDLLEADERMLLRRLCVFAGRFTLEDAESVCLLDNFPAANAFDSLSSLVDKSLVMKEDAKGLATYRLHETMREYAILKLQEAREVEIVGERCTDYYVARCLPTARQARYQLPEWLEWMDLEIDNIRAVLRHCVSRADRLRGIVIATSVGWFWVTRATTEGSRWLDELFALGPLDRGSGGWAYFMRGFLAVLQSDPAVARPWLKRATAAGSETGQLDLAAQSLTLTSIAENMAGDRASALRFLDEAEVFIRRLDDPLATLSVLQARALNGLFTGDLNTARTASSERVRLSRESGDLYGLEMMLLDLGTATLMGGDSAGSQPPFAESLRIAQQIDDRVALHYLLYGMACIAATSGQARLAAQLIGAGETVRAGIGASIIPTIAPLLVQAENSAASRLGPARFAAELQAGKLLSRDAAVALALGEPARVAPQAPDGAETGLIGKRETEVARLVADGFSNKQIGTRLFISERTVDSHVRSILNKLGFNSRAQIAAWITSSSR